MSGAGRGLILIAMETQEQRRRQAEEELVAMYRRPDALPLPPEESRPPWTVRMRRRVPRFLRRRGADARA
jgi:hypothetical protein